MNRRSQAQSNYANKKTAKILLFLAVLFLLQLSFIDKPIFAVPYFNYPKASSQNLATNYLEESISAEPIPQKSRAPEPSTLLLVLSGVCGVVVRFARRSFERLKRAMDILMAMAGLVVCSPLLLISGILIKATSKGPIIYKQKRVGRLGQTFEIYKLRTMRVDAEKETGAVWAKRDDPRLTSAGKILRNLHVDEIPQLLNVLKGQMSIVGPRPERPEIVTDLKKIILDYEKRLCVKPGITGLAQVWHKYDETIEDVKKKIKYDLLYIRKMCLWVDLRIMARTFTVVLAGKGAR